MVPEGERHLAGRTKVTENQLAETSKSLAADNLAPPIRARKIQDQVDEHGVGR